MDISLRSQPGEEQAPQRDLQEALARMLIGLVFHLAGRFLKKRKERKKERKKARKEMEKILARGEEVPPELEKEATRGMGRREKKKFLKKAAGKKKKRRIVGFLLVLGLLAAGAALAWRRQAG